MAFSMERLSSVPKPSSTKSASICTPPRLDDTVSESPSARLKEALKLSPPDKFPTGRLRPVKLSSTSRSRLDWLFLSLNSSFLKSSYCPSLMGRRRLLAATMMRSKPAACIYCSKVIFALPDRFPVTRL